ncbi:MAG: AhpD-like protein [Benjaminiella poitrasii]|nr:MAG: AhpD-like protein [Benjaminiella poitrasii]
MTLRQILKNLEHNQDILNDFWYIIAAVVISSVNKPDDIQFVYYAIVDQIENSSNLLSKEEKNKLIASVILRLREAILKSYIIIGFPKTINTLQQLANVTPEDIKALLPTKPLRKEESWSEVQHERQRGKTLFSKIYDRHTDKVIKNMYSTHPDLAQTALHQLYGPTLSETSILNAKETSLVTVAGLMIQDIPLQLVGHSHGALHNGATEKDLKRVETIVSNLADYYHCHSIAKL